MGKALSARLPRAESSLRAEEARFPTMRPILLALLVVPPTVQAQASFAPLRRPRPFALQLGAAHFPGGEAALQDSAGASVLMPDGDLVVLGSTSGALGETNAGGTDLFLARVDPVGELRWVRQIGASSQAALPGGDASGSDSGAALVLDEDGTLLVAGSTWSSLGEPNAGLADAFVARFTGDGDLLWLTQVGQDTAATLAPTAGATVFGDASGLDLARDLLLDPAGGFWIAGSTTSALSEPGAGEYDVFVAHCSDDGRVEWLRQLGSLSGAVGSYDPWIDNGVVGLERLPSGRLVLGVASSALIGANIAHVPNLLVLGTDGSVLSVLGGGGLTGIWGSLTVDAAGTVYVVGTRPVLIFDLDHQYDLLAQAVDPLAGQVLWTMQLDEQLGAALGLLDTGANEWGHDLLLDGAGGLRLVATTDGSLAEPGAGSDDLVQVALSAADGSVQWVRQFGEATELRSGVDAGARDLPAGRGSLGRDAVGQWSLVGTTRGSFAEPLGGQADILVLRLGPDGELVP